MNPNTATEYRNLPLNVLTESTTNPRRIFADVALKELAESIRVQGVLSPLLVRPLSGQNFEIVAGARRYRAAQIAEAATVPVRIVNLTDAEALEAALIELSIVVKRFLFVYAGSHVVSMETTCGFCLRSGHGKLSVGGFELLRQFSVTLLQCLDAESQRCHDPFVREPLTMLRNLAGGRRRGSSCLHDFVPQGLCPIEPCRRDARLCCDAAEVDFHFLRLHLSDRSGSARHRSVAAGLSTALQTCQVPNHDEPPVL
jgi:ParB family chromosome partitioning protein